MSPVFTGVASMYLCAQNYMELFPQQILNPTRDPCVCWGWIYEAHYACAWGVDCQSMYTEQWQFPVAA